LDSFCILYIRNSRPMGSMWMWKPFIFHFPKLISKFNNFIFFSDHSHKKFGRLWEQIVFPYEKLKTAYTHWHITPIQILAELRDPNRPDLIQQNMAFLPYRYFLTEIYLWSVINLELIPFVQHFIKNFDKSFYTTVLSCRFSV